MTSDEASRQLASLVYCLLALAEAEPSLPEAKRRELNDLAARVDPTPLSLAETGTRIGISLLSVGAFKPIRPSAGAIRLQGLQELHDAFPNPDPRPSMTVEELAAATKDALTDPSRFSRHADLLRRLAELVGRTWPLAPNR
jgi:hypothetical protein